MEPVLRAERRIVMRGAGSAPCICIAEKGPRSRFVGAAFVMAPETDFGALERLPGARKLAAAEIPGGGLGIELIDPAGNAVWLLADWTPVPALAMRAALHDQVNAPGRRPRINAGIRPPAPPPLVVRLGHMVLQVTDFPAMSAWYMRHLGLIPSDVQYLADGSPALTFFRLDLGPEPADHHSLVLLAGLENSFEHSAYEMIDLDAIGQRQQVLLAGGHKHMWGLGRHVLGSQIFNYWRDPDGIQFEHYTDGDLFTADYEPRYSPFAPGSIWAWGQDAPAALRGKPSPAMLWRIVKALATRRIALPRLKLLGQALSQPARPWL
jgi:catechol 2,3-dioxygenase-like lactoylglutathione lyase family enzyme